METMKAVVHATINRGSFSEVKFKFHFIAPRCGADHEPCLRWLQNPACIHLPAV